MGNSKIQECTDNLQLFEYLFREMHVFIYTYEIFEVYLL